MGERPLQQDVLFNGELWSIAGGMTSDVWHSTDGLGWTMATATPGFGGREQQQVAVFNDKLWLYGGLSASGAVLNDLWKSDDGVTWTQVVANMPFAARTGTRMLSFDNKLWVIAGIDTGVPGTALSDVWCSSDGVNWSEATADAGFPARHDFSATVFNGAMWIVGGDGSDYTTLNDVWYSSNGVNWTETTATPSFGKRMNASLFVFNNRLWLLGGSASSAGLDLNDIWSSTDGVNWTEETANAAFSARHSQQVVVDGSDLWMIGGQRFEDDVSVAREVWHSTDGKNWRLGVRKVLFPSR